MSATTADDVGTVEGVITRPQGRAPQLSLPVADPVVRELPPSPRRHRFAGIVLLVLGVILTVGPLTTGLFSDVAAGRAMLDDFEPRLQADKLAAYRSDVELLRSAATGLDQVAADEHVVPGRFPAVDDYRTDAPAITTRAGNLLDRIQAGVPDYRKVAKVGGLERIPFLLVVVGVASAVAGFTIMFGSRRTITRALLVAVVAGAFLAAYPAVGGLIATGSSGEDMLDTMAPVMTENQVRALQNDFVVVVTAVGVLDTDFRSVPIDSRGHAAVAALQQNWPRVSADLADLVGTINDNIPNYRALRGVNEASKPLGVSGFVALPWVLLGTGVIIVGAALVAWPRRRRMK